MDEEPLQIVALEKKAEETYGSIRYVYLKYHVANIRHYQVSKLVSLSRYN